MHVLVHPADRPVVMFSFVNHPIQPQQHFVLQELLSDQRVQIMVDGQELVYEFVNLL
jgi:hypothetical protein